jgi:hypothetical protein
MSELTTTEILGAFQLGIISMPEARKALGFTEESTKENN